MAHPSAMQLAPPSPSPSSPAPVSLALTQSPTPASVAPLLPQTSSIDNASHDDDADFTRSPQDSLQRKSRRRSVFAIAKTRQTRGTGQHYSPSPRDDLNSPWTEEDRHDEDISPTSAFPPRQPLAVRPVKLLVELDSSPRHSLERSRRTTSVGSRASSRIISNDPALVDPHPIVPCLSSTAANVLAEDVTERQQARKAMRALVQEEGGQTYEGKYQVSPRPEPAAPHR